MTSPAETPARGSAVSNALTALRKYDPGQELAWLMMPWASGYAAPVIALSTGGPRRPERGEEWQ